MQYREHAAMVRTEPHHDTLELPRLQIAGVAPRTHEPFPSRGASGRPSPRRAFLLFLFAALAVLGCAPRVTALRSEAQAPGVARITLHSVHRGEFIFMVWNETALPVTVDRDAVVLITPRVRRAWTRGTFNRRMVIVPAGGVHDVKMEFKLDDVNEGEEVEIDFSSALISQGRPVPIPTLTFRVID
jgi:hypothetical protein